MLGFDERGKPGYPEKRKTGRVSMFKYSRYTLYTSHDPGTGLSANGVLEARRHKEGEC